MNECKKEKRGGICFYNCDNIEFMKTKPDNYYDLAIVDPPYGIGQDETQNDLGGRKGFNKESGTFKTYHKTNWDNEVPQPEYFEQLFRVSKDQIIWGGNYFHNVDLEGVIVWNKGNSGKFKEGELAKTSFNTFKIYYYSRADAYINKIDIKIHPTQKPIDLYRFCILNYAKKGFKLLDTHGGSSSFAIASDVEGFDLDVCEIDEKYFDDAVKRFDYHKLQLKLF
jgi:site-specific DNA-methyltransferase (adenine-specific)